MPPFWLQMLLAILPQLPQTAEEIAAIYKPHAGTATGDKIAATFAPIANLAGAAAAFEVQHAAATTPAPVAAVTPPLPAAGEPQAPA